MINHPDVLRLYDGENWTVYDNTAEPVPFKSRYHGQHEILQPITLIHFTKYPVDVSKLIGKGQLLAGYGLRSEAESASKSFADMMSNDRLYTMWYIGQKAGIASADQEGSTTLCLSFTEMEEISELRVEAGELNEILDGGISVNSAQTDE